MAAGRPILPAVKAKAVPATTPEGRSWRAGIDDSIDHLGPAIGRHSRFGCQAALLRRSEDTEQQQNDDQSDRHAQQPQEDWHSHTPKSVGAMDN
jgi:hypothetical protein